MPSTRALTLVAALAAIAAVCTAQTRQGAPRTNQQQAQRKLPMDIRLELEQGRFLNKESMTARVVIHNTASTPMDVPDPENNGNTQPVYTIRGPSYPNGYSVHFRAVALGVNDPSQRPEPGATVRLAPGERHVSEIPLEQFVKFSQPGEYTVTASLEIGAAKTESAPVAFTIEQPAIRSMQLLIDDGVQQSNPIRVLCLVGGPKDARLYQAILREERPDLGEVSLAKLIRVATADPTATAVLGPWTNHDRLDSFLNRFAWRAGAVVGVEGLTGTPGMRLTLPAQTQAIVRPALMPDSGEVDLLALSGDGRQVRLLRFPPTGTAGERWSTQLPAAAVSGRAALAPSSAQARRAVVFVVREGAAVKMVLLEAAKDATSPTVRIVDVPGASVLSDSEPGIRVAADGSVRASALFAADPKTRGLVVADVTWPTGGGDGKVSVSSAGRLPAAPKSAAVTYASTPGEIRREWVVLLQDGRVVFRASPQRPRELNGTAAVPLNLLAMSQMTYLLTLDRQGLPQLELMH